MTFKSTCEWGIHPRYLNCHSRTRISFFWFRNLSGYQMQVPLRLPTTTSWACLSKNSGRKSPRPSCCCSTRSTISWSTRKYAATCWPPRQCATSPATWRAKILRFAREPRAVWETWRWKSSARRRLMTVERWRFWRICSWRSRRIGRQWRQSPTL